MEKTDILKSYIDSISSFRSLTVDSSFKARSILNHLQENYPDDVVIVRLFNEYNDIQISAIELYKEFMKLVIDSKNEKDAKPGDQ